MTPTYRNYLQQQADNGVTGAVALLNMVGDDGVFGTNQWRDNSTGQIWSKDGEAGNLNAALWERYNNSGPGALQDSGAGTGPSEFSAPRAVQNDPYARYGGEANYNAKRNAYLTSQGNVESGGRTSLTDVENTYGNKYRTLFNNAVDTQNELNTGRENNALSLRRTMANIINGVRQGIRSGGVTLSTMNALDSGASEAMARALARQGNAQGSEANNQWQAQENQFDTQQGLLDRTVREGKSDLDIWKATETNRVRQQLASELNSLGAQAGADGFNGLIDNGIAERLVNEAVGKLAAIDSGYDWNSQRKLTPEEITQKAVAADLEGRGAPIFSVSGDNVMNRQGAVTTSQIPFYVRRGRAGQTA